MHSTRKGPRALILAAAVLWPAAACLAPAARADEDVETPPVAEPVPLPAPAADAPPAQPAPAEPGAPVAEGEPLLRIEDEGGEPVTAEVVGARPSILGTAPVADPKLSLRKVPGSGFSESFDDLARYHRSDNLQEALRGAPGVTVRAETNAGVVPNIGIRGLNPDRSEKLLILEDGVPAGVAPYIVNAAYYLPPIQRMERVELLKGSGQILYGPQTVGGVLNLVTPSFTCDPCGRAVLTGGTEDYWSGLVQYGDTIGRWAYHLSFYHERGDGWRQGADFDLTSLSAKVRYYLTRDSHLTAKFSYYEADTQNTYLGLTEGLFETSRFFNPSPFDTYKVDWTDGQVTWQQSLGCCWDLLVNFYIGEGTRDWNRQDFARNTGFAAPPGNTVATFGDPGIDGGAIYMRESFGSRDRDFLRWGIEPRLIGKYTLFGRNQAAHVGMRFHKERFVNERNNRTSLIADPVTRTREIQRAEAWSAFAQNDTEVWQGFHVIGGLRMEHYEYERQFEIENGAPSDTLGTSSNTEFIPGLGFTYDLPRDTTLFGGVHRGFAPPRTSAAIDADGVDQVLDAERAWEFEIGLRGSPWCWLDYEVTGFYYDFSNQIVPANESGGASTENTNAGQTEHYGAEIGLRADLLALRRGCCRPCDPKLFLDASWTWVETENVTPGGLFEGLDLPYAPRFFGRLGLLYEHPGAGFSIGASASYTGEQFADQANTVAPSADGLTGTIPDYWVLDLTARYRIPHSSVSIVASINNALDKKFIASRAPQGIFPGLPRRAFLAVEVDF